MESEAGQIGVEAAAAKRALSHTAKELCRPDREHIEGLTAIELRDTNDRFNMWARSLGALQKGPASLDFRIAHDGIFDEVFRLLRQLNEYLSDLLPIAKAERQQVSWSKDSQKITADEFSDFELSSDDEISRGSNSDVTGDVCDTTITESSDLLLSANDSITSLMRLSIQIHRSSRKGKFARCALDQNFDFEADKNHVRELFPSAVHNDSLVTKLARANAQRRHWLIYRRQHIEKLGMDRVSGDAHTDASRTSIAPEEPRLAERSAAPSLPDTVASMFRRSGTGRSLDVMSQSDYTDTQQGLSTVAEGDKRLLVPEPPGYVRLGQPFSCPYCQNIIEISGKDAWQRHVHADLSSYMCIFADCDEPLFESRLRWIDHMSKAHLIEWRCELCSSVQRSASSMTTHLMTLHTEVSESQVQALVEKYSRSLEYISTSACPLCDYTSVLHQKSYSDQVRRAVDIKAFARHLSRHLEQLALFVLPRDVLAECEDEEDDAQSSTASDSEESLMEEDVITEKTEEHLQDLTKVLTGKAFKQDDSDVFHEPPDLAMGWQPPHDFTPPAEEFDSEDPDVLPSRQEPIFGGDLYTPGWARGFGAEKEGFCGRCTPGQWLNMPGGDYEFHMTYLHGSPASGVPLQRPSCIRRVSRSLKRWEGYCDECCNWMVIRRTDRGWNWYRHWLLDHADTVKNRSAMILAGADPRVLANMKSSKQLGTDQASTQSERFRDEESYDNVDSDSLLTSIAQENLAEVRNALAAEFSQVDFPGVGVKLGKMLLERSAYQGSLDVTMLLLQVGASPDFKDGDSPTALDLAVDAGFYRIASLLIDRGAPLSLSRHACKILDASVCRTDPPDVEISAPSIPQADIARQYLGSVRAAVKSGNIVQLRRILEVSSGPGMLDLEEGSETGSTPFLIASCVENQDIMTLLVSQGANINATNRLGWTALMLAAKRGNRATVCFLLEHAADVNHHSPDRWTALAEAASRSNKGIMKLLLDAGADPESVSQHDWTPLMHVAYHGDLGAVDMLIDAGASVHHGSQRDESPLLLAAASGSTVVVRRLLDEGCPADPAWVRPALEEEPASVERVYQLGWTPLMLACQVGSLAIARMLLDVGANTEPRSPMFNNALQIARENGRLEIVALLEHLEPNPPNWIRIHTKRNSTNSALRLSGHRIQYVGARGRRH